MKKFVFIFLIFATGSVFSQTVLYSEDFEAATISLTTTSTSGTADPWSVSSSLQTSGTYSDTNIVQASDTIYLTSPAFSTVTYTSLMLNFNQICKIDYFDKAYIEVSSDSGATWTQLTNSEYNGSGFMNSNTFSSISYQQWNPTNVLAVPNSNWWRSESFDISSYGNSLNTVLRFVLVDSDNNGSRGSYGWLIDDVEVIGATCELIPPTVSQPTSNPQGTVYSTGPYTISANINDASGIFSAEVHYSLNGGANQTVVMSLVSGNLYEGNIPSATIGDTICYKIIAIDASSCSNTTTSPSVGCKEFIVYRNAPSNCIGTPVNTYPYIQEFDSFTAGNGISNSGTLSGDWYNTLSDDFDWYVFNQSTASTNTGPTGDHTTGSGNFLYTESSSNFNNTAILESPCFDLSPLSSVTFSFWYHMYGATMGELHIDLETSNGIIQDIIPPIIGDQGNQWRLSQIDLTAYNSHIVKVHFRGITGTSFTSDIAIDDVSITGSFVGIEMLENTKPLFSFYPNPAKEKLTVILNENGLNGELELMDISGKVILSKQLTEINNKIVLGELSQGIYILKYINKGNQYMEKLIINQ